MADGEGFEPPRPGGLPVFKTGAIDRSATRPTEAMMHYHAALLLRG